MDILQHSPISISLHWENIEHIKVAVVGISRQGFGEHVSRIGIAMNEVNP